MHIKKHSQKQRDYNPGNARMLLLQNICLKMWILVDSEQNYMTTGCSRVCTT